MLAVHAIKKMARCSELSHVSHVQALATPKSLPAGFLEDRRSVYWDNNIHLKDYSKATSFALTPRQEALVYSKKLHPKYIGDRPSPIWPVPWAARRASPSPRVIWLAQSKQLHPAYQPCKEVVTTVPETVLRARPSHHLCQLARHKTYPPLPIKPHSEWEWGEWEADISTAARSAVSSAQVAALAEPKDAHRQYQPCKDVQWSVSKAALTHVASERMHKLARPKNRHGEMEDYNPRAWSVSRAALATQASTRIAELATPLPRKCRTKK